MKKYIRLPALVLVLCAMLCACSANNKSEKETNEPSTLNTEPTVETGLAGEMIYEGADTKALLDNDSCSVTLQKAEIDSLSDYCWSVTLVNKSTSTQIFTVENAFVNDFSFDPVWAVKVPAGVTAEERIIWSAPEMQLRGITQISRVDLKLRVFADDGTEFANADITNYPSGKSAYLAKSRAPQTTDVVLIDNAEYTAIITGFDPENRWGCALELYLQNKTDKTVRFSAKNVLVSGCDCDPQWSVTLPGGKQSISEMIWFDEQLEEAGEVTGIIFDLEIRDENGNVISSESRTFIP